ncbi:MAG: cellulose biosynthesis cyclic di-GMP-binding regulatory protein BcsB, partial [Clostridia bacterium]|nr:cellulose biosynthesis cyclic di-GMP-binding regulatory protein BcsB [Clostridia bacterium]
MKQMKHALKGIISLLICLVCICGIHITGFAAQKSSMDLQMFEKTVKLDMPKNTASFWFLLPDGTVVDDQSYMNLDLKFSETLIYERSSITLEMNGTVIETKWILDIDDQTTCTWKVKIPEDVLKIGELNELKIITTQRSIEGDCADIDNPSNWVSLLNTSYLHVSIAEKASPKLSNLYAFFYENPADKGVLETEFIVPEQADATVKAGMLKTASAVGSYYPYNDKLISHVSEKEVSQKGEHKIAFGYDDTLKSGSGSISVEDQGTYYKADIMGKDQEGFDKAVAFFSANEFMKQISRSSVVVTSDIRDRVLKHEFKKNEAGYYQFSDFGYQTVNLAGAFHQSANFTFQQPGGVRSGDDSYVLIRFRHSKALEADHSLLTVYCDSEALDSVKLSSSNADYGELKVKIPVKYLKEDTINLNIDCYNYLGKIDCSKDYYDTAWTVIDETSNIYFEPGNIGVTPSLYHTPAFNNLT